MNLKDILTPKQLATKLNVTEQTILQWREKGMPYIKTGKFIFILQSSFVKWFKTLEGIDGVQIEKEEKGSLVWDDFTSFGPDHMEIHQGLTSIQAYKNLYGSFGCFNPECNYGVDLETHHIIPKSQGGKDNFENYILLCRKCHHMLKNHSNYEERQIILRTYKYYFESKIMEINMSGIQSYVQ